MARNAKESKAFWEDHFEEGPQIEEVAPIVPVAPAEIVQQTGAQAEVPVSPVVDDSDIGPAMKPAPREPDPRDEALADAVAHNPHLQSLAKNAAAKVGTVITRKAIVPPVVTEEGVRKAFTDAVGNLSSIVQGIRNAEKDIANADRVCKSYEKKLADDRAAIPVEPKAPELEELLQREALGGEGSEEAGKEVRRLRREFNTLSRIYRAKTAEVELDCIPTEQTLASMRRLKSKHERELAALRESRKKAVLEVLVARAELAGFLYVEKAKELERHAFDVVSIGSWRKRLGDPNDFGVQVEELCVPHLGPLSTKMYPKSPHHEVPGTWVGIVSDDERYIKLSGAEDRLRAELEDLRLGLPEEVQPQRRVKETYVDPSLSPSEPFAIDRSHEHPAPPEFAKMEFDPLTGKAVE